MSYGRKLLTASTGIPLSISADGRPRWKVGGITIDWTTVTALAAPLTTNEQITYATGTMLLRYGQLMVLITATGKYGPYDPAASDGRQTLILGKCGWIERTILQLGLIGFTTANTSNTGLVMGGDLFVARLIQSGVATHTLALGPTLAEALAACPFNPIYDA